MRKENIERGDYKKKDSWEKSKENLEDIRRRDEGSEYDSISM